MLLRAIYLFIVGAGAWSLDATLCQKKRQAIRGRKEHPLMTHARTRLLLAAATVVSGILAGTVVDRAVVGAPAWQVLGAEAWGQYSRHADLGTGLVAYPIEGIGATLLLICAALSNHFDRDGQRGIGIPLILAVVFSLAGLLLTLKAAPIMLSLGTSLTAAALQQAMDQFFLWGLYLRGGADALAFIGAVWALSSLRASDRSTEPSSSHSPMRR